MEYLINCIPWSNINMMEVLANLIIFSDLLLNVSYQKKWKKAKKQLIID